MTLSNKPPDDKIKRLKPPATMKPPAAASANKQQKRIPKTFSIKTWDGDKEGEKIIEYGDSGMGKTTLAAMLPTPVFIGIDDGGRKIKHPVTGKSLQYIPGVETFEDYLDATAQISLFNDYETIVTDTGTILEELALAWVLANIKKDDKYVKNLEQYGWGKGYRHLYDTMHRPLANLDTLVRHGKNVVILCQMNQVSIANAGGEDFLCDVPKLMPKHGSTPAIWGLFNEWADHVFKIGYSDIKAVNKKAASSNERVVFVHPQIHFKAKSRTIPNDYPIVSFDDPTDDSIWQFLFNEAWKDLPQEGE